jgi:hypothetical protein
MEPEGVGYLTIVRCASTYGTWTHDIEREYLGYETHGTEREYLGYEPRGIEREDHVQLGTIVARTRDPLTARFHRSLHTQYATEAGEVATRVDFKLSHGADFRMRL